MGAGHNVQSHSLWKSNYIMAKEGGINKKKDDEYAVSCVLFLTSQLGLHLDVVPDPKNTHV